MVVWRLTIPRSVDDKQLVAFLGSLHGLARSRWWILDRPTVTLEVDSTQGQIIHRLVVADQHAAMVRAALHATMPGVRFEEDDDRPAPKLAEGIEFTATNQLRSLRTDQLEASEASVLSSLQPVSRGEHVRLQWILAPAPSPRPPHLKRASQKDGFWLDSNGLHTSELVRAQRQKQVEPLFLCVGRIAVAAADQRRARSLIHRTFRAIRRSEAPGIRLRRRMVLPEIAARRVRDRVPPLLLWPLTLNAAELAGVLGVPLDGPSLFGLPVTTARQLPPPNRAKRGLVIGVATYPGSSTDISLPNAARLQHTLTLGPTGTGKSTLQASMALQDIEEGRGLVLLDPKGDLVADILQRIPDSRREDVIVLDATDSEAPVGLNPIGLRSRDEGAQELAVDQVVGTMHNLFRASWGVRTADILRATLATLVATRAADGTAWTLADIPAVLANPNLRTRLARNVTDPTLQAFWTQYEAWSEAQRIEYTAPLLNKLRTILLRPRLRRILGQSDGIDLASVIRRRQILLVPLPKGQLGAEAASLLGSLLVAQLWSAVIARSGIQADRRSMFVAYIDEAKDFLHLPVAILDMLAEARGLGLSLNLATQHLTQFPKELRDGVLANARTKLLFRLPHDDAVIMSRLVAPMLQLEDLKGLPRYEIVVHSDATESSFTTTAKTRPLDPMLNSADQVRLSSRTKWGRSASDIDAALVARQELHGTADRSFGPRKRGDGAAV